MKLTEVIRLRDWCPIKFKWFPFDVHNCTTLFHLKQSMAFAEVEFKEDIKSEEELIVPRWKIGIIVCEPMTVKHTDNALNDAHEFDHDSMVGKYSQFDALCSIISHFRTHSLIH